MILTADVWREGVSAGILTSLSFAQTLGDTGTIIVAISTALFAFSTLLGWSYYGEKAIEYLFNEKAISAFRIVFVLVVMVGATRELSFVWNFSDLMNGLMAIPNLIGILLLSKVVKQESQRYFLRPEESRQET